MKRWVVLCLVLAGCQSVSEIVPIGKDSYMVGASARGGMTSSVEVAALGIKKANEFCAAQGKKMQVTSSQNSGVRGWTPQEAQIQFQCLNASDPDYQHTHLRKDADTVIRIEK